jgi:hypothetical protein
MVATPADADRRAEAPLCFPVVGQDMTEEPILLEMCAIEASTLRHQRIPWSGFVNETGAFVGV